MEHVWDLLGLGPVFVKAENVVQSRDSDAYHMDI